MTIRLVTYNIHKGIGGRDRRYDLDRIVDVLKEADADLVCLQEVSIDLPRTARHDQARILIDQLQPLSSAYQQNVYWKAGGYGNLILSRWDILEQHPISLQFGTKKPRGAQLAVINSPDGLLRLANWHLGLSEKERRWQAAHLLAHPQFQATAHHPTLLCGDFNDWRNTLGRRILLPQGFSQATLPSGGFRSFPAALPVMALDKCFHCENIVVDSARLIRNRATRQASDHLPLLVEFRLNPFGEGVASEPRS
jgi:endonuclease/exonuclease/phosphatase family metal-dependent hydrolase